MTELDFESSQLRLLTEALRAGPGTPEWRAALATVEQAGGADEYKLLYAARERLASGQKYREVRAGVGFTRKVFESIESEEAATRKTPASANLIAGLSAVVILGILAVVAYFVMPYQPAGTTPELAQTYFVNTVSQSNFDLELGMDWAPFGVLGLTAKNGLRPRLADLTDNYRGGGVFYERTHPANQPFSMQATIVLNKPSEDIAVGVFVTDDPNFSGDSATSEHELVCLLRGDEASVVLPGGHVQKQGVHVSTGRTPIEVHVNVSRDQATVEIDGKTIWSGPSGLDAGKPRLAGVRFLARAGKGEEAPVVQSVRVMTPQK